MDGQRPDRATLCSTLHSPPLPRSKPNNHLLYTRVTQHLSPPPHPQRGREQSQCQCQPRPPPPAGSTPPRSPSTLTTAFSLHPPPRPSSSIIVEDLIRILQDGVDNPNLPPGIRDVGPRVRVHEGWSVITYNYRQLPSFTMLLRREEVMMKGHLGKERGRNETYPKQMAKFAAFILFAKACSCTRLRCCEVEGG